MMPIQVSGVYLPSYDLFFDGSGDYIDFSNPIIPAGQKSILFEISKMGIPGTVNFIFENHTSSSQRGDAAYIDANGYVIWSNSKDVYGDLRYAVLGSTNICDGDKHIVELRWDGSININAVEIYIDGSLDGCGTADSTESLQGTLNLTIGRKRTTSDYLNAKLYKLLISNGSVYIAKYFFYEGTGSALGDSSGNGYDGIITGATWEKTT